jgi:hypothetical protein
VNRIRTFRKQVDELINNMALRTPIKQFRKDRSMFMHDVVEADKTRKTLIQAFVAANNLPSMDEAVARYKREGEIIL